MRPPGILQGMEVTNMKKYLLYTLLTISLIFNAVALTTVARVGYIFSHMDELEFRMDFAADALDMSTEQRDAFVQLTRELHAIEATHVSTQDDAVAELIAVSEESEIDAPRLDTALRALQSVETGLHPHQRTYIREVWRLLTPEQRETLIEFRSRPPAHMRGPPLGPLLELLPPAPLRRFLP